MARKVGRPAKRGRHLRSTKPKMGKPGRPRKRGVRKGTFGAKIGGLKRSAAARARKKPSKRVQMKAMEIISRRTQPRWRITILQPELDKEVTVGGRVASSWIRALAWDNNRGVALMYLLSGRLYEYVLPFYIFEMWFYAHSKGTYFHYKNIRKYPCTRLV